MAMATALPETVFPLNVENLIFIIVGHPKGIVCIGGDDMIGLGF